MAEIDISPKFGAELKDAFKPVNSWVNNGIAWLDDIQQFYRERSAIEKEYSTKLAALAKKYFEKKARKSSSLSVGDTPAMTPGSLESASLTTWTTHLTTLESRAAEHDKFGGDLIFQVAEPLKAFGARYEELRKRHAEYADKLEKERDSTYNDLRKAKGKYDASCQEVENRRKKTESSFDYAKTKAQNAYHQQTLEMHNVKNSYLISIHVTNKQKEKYYHEYVPELLDSLQDLSESRVAKLNAIWTLAASLESGTLGRSMELVTHLGAEITRNQPQLDSLMFLRHNVQPWQEPASRAFEPSPVWHDDEAMVTDEAARVFLRNVLGKSKAQLGELRREVDRKRREVDGVRRVREAVRAGRDRRDEVEVVRAVFALQEELHQLDSRRLTAEVETLTITATVGDVTLGAKGHNFRSQTFKIPTNCDLCGDRIWGLSAKGFDCRDCGYTCHSKCEMKVPAECPGEQSKEERKKLKAERQEAANALLAPAGGGGGGGGVASSVAELPALSRSNTMTSLSSGYAASANRSIAGAGPASPREESPPERSGALASSSGNNAPPPTAARKNRVVAPPPMMYVGDGGGATNGGGSTEQRGKMLYAYESNGEGEITVPEGRELVILEPDDGSGWMKVKSGVKEGLVPASYVEAIAASAPPQLAIEPARPSSTYSNSGSSLGGGGGGGGGAKKKGPAVAPRRGAKKLRYVEALYDYAAGSEAEHSMEQGDRLVLIKEDPGDGWTEVEKGGVTKSVPTSYVRAV